MTHDTVIVGGRGVGEALAEAVASDVDVVTFLGDDDSAIERAAAVGADARRIDANARAALDDEGVERPRVAIVASREDGWNLLVAQLLRARRSERVIALVNDPNNVEAFADAGVEPVCASTALASALDRKRRGVEATEEPEREGSATESGADPDDETDRESRDRFRSDGGGET